MTQNFKYFTHLQTISIYLFMTVLLTTSPAVFSQVLIQKTDFNLTFPSGWMELKYPGTPVNVSGFNVMDTIDNESAAFGQGLQNTGGMTASQLAAIYANAALVEMARTDSTNKVLGNYTFITVGYKDTSVDADTSSRVRIYVTTKGNYVFAAWLVYNTDKGPASLARMEAALATLNITASAAIRHFSATRKDKLPGQYFDIQGRNWDVFSNRMHRIPVFQRP
jgi:hypothetical protein